MQIHTLSYHPDFPTTPGVASGKEFRLQLFEGDKTHESVGIRLEPSPVSKATALVSTYFASYGPKSVIAFAVPQEWKSCTLVALHYTNMVIVACTEAPFTDAAGLYRRMLEGFNSRKLKHLPACYSIILTEGHNLRPANIRRLQAA